MCRHRPMLYEHEGVGLKPRTKAPLVSARQHPAVAICLTVRHRRPTSRLTTMSSLSSSAGGQTHRRPGSLHSSQTPGRASPSSPAPRPTPAPFVTVGKIGLARPVKEAVLGGQRGCIVWLTGLSGAGKSAVADVIEVALAERGVASALMDGDALRTGLCAGLGFSAEDRAENVRRAGEAALLAAEAGLIVLAALVSPYAAGRTGVRSRCEEKDVPFIEVHVATPLAVCAARDVKGLYAAAKEGRLPGLTGLCPSAPYEAPARPEIRLEGEGSVPESAAEVVAYLEGVGLVPRQATGQLANNAVPFPPGLP